MTVSELDVQLSQVYDVHAAQEILRLANASRQRMDFCSHEDLVRAAAELDVPAHLIVQAEELVRDKQSELDDRAEFRRVKIKETAKFVFVSIPVLAWCCMGHSFALGSIYKAGNGFSVLQHGFTALKGSIKGLGAVFFSKSTRHEMEFQAWRNKRFYVAEYGSEDPTKMLDWYFRGKKCEDYHALIDWLVNVNGIDPTIATMRVDAYKSYWPRRVIKQGSPRPPGA